MKDKKVRIVSCGPYEVSGEVPLRQAIIGVDEKGAGVEWIDGKVYEVEDPYYLCRCGHSKDKPFCDGSHLDQNFYGDEIADKRPYAEQAIHYTGKEMDLLDQESLCAVARFCDVGKQVWGYIEEPDGPQDAQKAIQGACDCPSGRLTAMDKDGKLIELELEQEICLVQDPARGHRGPLWVKGGIEIQGEEGAYEVRNRVTLCRCGQSNNMPFCDATHLCCPHMEGQDE